MNKIFRAFSLFIDNNVLGAPPISIASIFLGWLLCIFSLSLRQLLVYFIVFYMKELCLAIKRETTAEEKKATRRRLFISRASAGFDCELVIFVTLEGRQNCDREGLKLFGAGERLQTSPAVKL